MVEQLYYGYQVANAFEEAHVHVLKDLKHIDEDNLVDNLAQVSKNTML